MSSVNKKYNGVKSDRARVFSTVFYPESMPDNFDELVLGLHVPFLLSPLHDRDISANGEDKKSHYHGVFLFSSVKTPEQVRALIEPLGAVGLEVVSDTRAYCRYLCHLDNPEKAQYPTDLVRAFSGADYASIISSGSDKYKAVGEMIEFIEENDIISYRQMLHYARDNRDDWYRALCDNCSMVILEYIKSRFWELYKAQNEILEAKKGG